MKCEDNCWRTKGNRWKWKREKEILNRKRKRKKSQYKRLQKKESEIVRKTEDAQNKLNKVTEEVIFLICSFYISGMTKALMSCLRIQEY